MKKHLILNIGTSCFVRCSGCYNHFGNSILKKNTVTNEVVLKFLKIATQYGFQKVTIGGGDPLSRTGITELLENIYRMGFTINLDTVGTAFIKSASTIFWGKLAIPRINLHRMKDFIHILGIPIDGSTDAVAAKFRSGRDNFINEQLQIVENAARCGVKVCVNTVVHQHNLNDLGHICKLISGYKIEKWQLFQYMPIGPLGYHNRNPFFVSDEEFRKSVSEIYRCMEKAGFSVEIKDVQSRRNLYLIIDDAGYAWLPGEFGKERSIIGSIQTEPEMIFRKLLKHSVVLKCPT